MTENEQPKSTKKATQEARKARLAQELRQNLRRRKTQAKGSLPEVKNKSDIEN